MLDTSCREVRAHFAGEERSIPAAFDHFCRCSTSACPCRALPPLLHSIRADIGKYLSLKAEKTTTWCTGTAWKSRKNLLLLLDPVSLSMQFTCLHSVLLFQMKTFFIKRVGNTNKKKASWSNLAISHLIRKTNISVKCNWTEYWITGGIKQSSKFNSKPQSAFCHLFPRRSAVYRVPCSASQFLALKHLWSYNNTDSSCYQLHTTQPGLKLVLVKAQATFRSVANLQDSLLL